MVALCLRYILSQFKESGVTIVKKVRDEYLDVEDENFLRFGRILEREGFVVLLGLRGENLCDINGGEENQTPRPLTMFEDLLASALSLQAYSNKRDVYLCKLAGYMDRLRQMGEQEYMEGLVQPLSSPLEASPIATAKVILEVRLCDGALRLTRDALLTSARRIQSIRKYWRRKYRPFSKARDHRNQLLEIDALWDYHLDQVKLSFQTQAIVLKL